jgi:ribosomal protein S18 acetylase RimI-like enzyme
LEHCNSIDKSQKSYGCDIEKIMTVDIRIRHIEESDYDAIISLLNEWWGGRPMATMLPRLFFRHFSETGFFAELGDQAVGFLIGFFSARFNSEAYIHFAGVHPNHRKKGIGRYLYHRFFDVSRKHGRSIIRCVTSPVNKKSIAFHRSMGFQLEPSTENSNGIPIHRNYDGPGEDRVLFLKRL